MPHYSLKTVLLRSTMLVGAAAFALPALAQNAGPVQPSATPAPVNAGAPQNEAVAGTSSSESTPPVGAGEGGDDTIIVTGSLIRNPNLERSAPVLVTTSDEIELRASNVAEEVIRDLPGVVPNIGSSVNNGNTGASFVDLRGLDSNRNIVLLDGNRITPARLEGEVDLNNIPLSLIERVETLTGAASTTYGADAVTGVVNFLTKQNFSGLDLAISEQITEEGDGNTFRADLTMGGNFADDKGNVTLSIGYQQADPIFQGDRSFSRVSINAFSGDPGGSSTAVPSTFSFQGGGRTADDPLALSGNFQLDPATGAARAAYAPFNFNPFNVFQVPFERFNIFAQGRYEIADGLEVYSRGLFSKNSVSTVIAPSGVFASDVTIPLSNPFLPAALRTQFCNNQDFDSATDGIQTLNAAQCAAGAAATSPTDPNYRTFSTSLRRRTTEVGSRISDYDTTVFDYRAGVRGSITDSLDFDVNGSYGESENIQSIGGYVLTSRARQALLATNTTTCLDDSNGCVPVNVFGPQGSITPEQAAFLTATSTSTVRTSLAQVRAVVSGDFGFSLPSAADPIGFAVGGEYRNYQAQQSSDLLAQTAGELGGAGGAAPNIDGGYEVKEGFAELVAPLVQDKPFFQSLTLEAGVRYSDYEVEAPGTPTYDTWTYKAGGSWEPTAGVKLRGSYSRAARAPNINELFEPNTVGLTNLSVDPCQGAAPVGNAALTAVCIAQGAPAFTIGNIQPPAAGQINATSGGNLNIRPEKADTYTGGFVLQPFAGVSFTVDYYRIKVKGAVSEPLPGDAVSACFANITAASATDPNCTIIGRNPTTGALDGDPATTTGLFLARSNLGTLFTDGIDVSANYSREIGFAKLGLSFTGNYTLHSKFRATPTALNRECVGYFSVNCSFTGSIQPEYQWSQRTTLGFDSFDVSLLWRHISKNKQEPDDVINGNGPALPQFGTLEATNYFDLSTRISVMENLSFTITVQNLLDQAPRLSGADIGSTTFGGGNTFPSTYDTLGRRYAFSARVKF